MALKLKNMLDLFSFDDAIWEESPRPKNSKNVSEPATADMDDIELF